MSDISKENMRKTKTGVIDDVPFDITVQTLIDRDVGNSLFAVLKLYTRTGIKEYIDNEVAQTDNIHEGRINGEPYPRAMWGMQCTSFTYTYENMINNEENLVDNVLNCAYDIVADYRAWAEDHGVIIDKFALSPEDMSMYVENSNGEEFNTYQDLKDDILYYVGTGKGVIRTYLKETFGDYVDLNVFDDTIEVDTDSFISFLEENDDTDRYEEDTRVWLENNAQIPDPFSMKDENGKLYYEDGQGFEFDVIVDDWDLKNIMPEYTVHYNSEYSKVYDDELRPRSQSGFKTEMKRIREMRSKIFKWFSDNTLSAEKLEKIIKIIDEN